MNNLLNEYLRFNFELNIELNHFLARFNIKMNIQNLSGPWQVLETLLCCKKVAGFLFYFVQIRYWLDIPKMVLPNKLLHLDTFYVLTL